MESLLAIVLVSVACAILALAIGCLLLRGRLMK
jgi:hypothetical protein